MEMNWLANSFSVPLCGHDWLGLCGCILNWLSFHSEYLKTWITDHEMGVEVRKPMSLSAGGRQCEQTQGLWAEFYDSVYGFHP